MTADQEKVNAALVDSLGSALRSGDHGLKMVPALLRKLLTGDAWRSFVTQRGERVHHERFADFVQAPPLKGLGATMDLIDRIVGTDDPELLILLRVAKTGRPGRPKVETENPSESNGFSSQGEASDYTSVRLAQEAPEEFAAVQRGEKSIHAAAVAAGIRRPRIPVRLDDPASAVRSLKSNSTPEFWAELRRLIAEDA